MERNENPAVPTASARPLAGAPIDWPAIFGGVVVAAAIAGLLTTFGAALGLSTVSVEPGEGSFNVWLIVTALWVVVALVVSYMAGGYVAGRLRRPAPDVAADEVSTRDGLNGLVVWGLGMLLTAWMAAGALGGLATAAGTGAQALGSAVGGVAQGAGAALGGAVRNADDGALDYVNGTLMRPALDGMRQADGMTTPATPAADDAELARQTGVVLGNVLRTGEIAEDDRAFLIAAVASRSGQSRAEVEARVDEAVTRIQDIRAEAARMADEAEQAAIDAAETARIGAILTAFLLTASALVAGAAAVSGAVRGGRHRDEGRMFAGLSYRL